MKQAMASRLESADSRLAYCRSGVSGDLVAAQGDEVGRQSGAAVHRASPRLGSRRRAPVAAPRSRDLRRHRRHRRYAHRTGGSGLARTDRLRANPWLWGHPQPHAPDGGEKPREHLEGRAGRDRRCPCPGVHHRGVRGRALHRLRPVDPDAVRGCRLRSATGSGCIRWTCRSPMRSGSSRAGDRARRTWLRRWSAASPSRHVDSAASQFRSLSL